MNKLKSKIFYTIFVILSIFSVIVIFSYNYKNYTEEERRVENQLRSINRINPPFASNAPQMRYMDSNIYIVTIKDDKVYKITSHGKNEEISNELYLKANEINDNSINNYIGNLYINTYSYKKSNNSIIIIDNSETNNRLKMSLLVSICYLFIIEIISYIIANTLSKWIIKPVIETFEKQKEFIADASHELKTPLAVIMASADTLEKDNNKKWIHNIQNESERMNKLITNLLDLSKVENNNFKEEVNLSKLVEKSTLILESLMYEKNISLEDNIEENIMFNCNQDEMKELMSILLDNAIKHSDKNGKIIVNLYKEKNNLFLEVKNKGEKIPEGEEEKIFERFYRVDKSRNRNENRYGLGLAIAKSIVEKHDGVISASSKNNYTTFKIVLKKK